MAGGQERKLIERERPGNPHREHERDPPDRSRLDLLDELSEPLDVLRTTEGEGTRNGLARSGAAGYDKRVVGKPVSLRRLHTSGRDIDRCEGTSPELGAQALGEGAEWEAVDAAQPERLCQRSIEELWVGCQELDAYAFLVAPVHASMIAGSGRTRLDRFDFERSMLVSSVPRSYEPLVPPDCAAQKAERRLGARPDDSPTPTCNKKEHDGRHRYLERRRASLRVV